MLRQVISIDRGKCNGCGECADACHEGAIAMINGKAKLIREDHCDGLGSCLPVCEAGALTVITKDALPFSAGMDEIPMMKASKCDCIDLVKNRPGSKGDMERWPIQLKLVPLKAAFLKNADILIAGDCTAFVCKDFRERFIKDRVMLIGCPKLDREDYTERLRGIIDGNEVRSVTLVRIDVPCCADMTRMVRDAVRMSFCNVVTEMFLLSTDGSTVE